MEWLEPWCAIADGGRASAAIFEDELFREIGPGHALHAIRVEAIALHCGCDDVLFRLLDGSERVAVVHLTWTRNPPEKPPWPATEIYPDLESWAEQRMRPDHKEYTD